MLLGGCAAAGGNSGNGGISHPGGARDLVLRVETSGGFIAPGSNFSQIPEFSLFADGTVVLQGPQIEIYPGPALPSVQTFRVDEAGMQAMLRAARAAGLLRLQGLVGGPGVPDVGSTTFTLVAGGSRHVVRVNAGFMQERPPGTQILPRGPVGLLESLRARLVDVRSWLPKGSVDAETTFVPRSLAVLVRPGSAGPLVGGMKEPAVEWPLAMQPLSSFGHPFGPIPGSSLRCGVVTAADAATVLSAASRANQLTPWRSSGENYSLSFRPVLPDGWGVCGSLVP